ncbi:hypothetical protein HA075_25730 [bacterium BFN5]|nr:hypothetical protein HA075_25730 [bacterium BFN5]
MVVIDESFMDFLPDDSHYTCRSLLTKFQNLVTLIAVYLDRPQHRQQFLARIQAMPEVLECHHIAGDEDYLLKIRCRNTRDLERIISDEIKSIEGVIKTRTTIILATVKETPILPLTGLCDPL